ncbi:MAG TPA: hypothetical protein VGP96_15710 [Candidatus Dormibacteraeota bacterium]|nr:hypothetical protein [Candidatus Dormibacteraeota bacterium]
MPEATAPGRRRGSPTVRTVQEVMLSGISVVMAFVTRRPRAGQAR